MKTEYKFIKFTEQTMLGSGRQFWIIQTNKTAGISLGTIQWYVPWRRYVFCPYADTLYDNKCLNDIISFIKEITFERKAEK